MRSLRRSALLWTTVLLTGVGVLAFFISYDTAREGTAEFLDGQLRQIALNAGDGVIGATPPSDDKDPEDELVIDVWNTKGGSVRRAAGGLLPLLSQLGFGTIHARGESWRVYLARDARTTVEVGQRMVVREEIAQASAFEAGAPILATIPLAWLVIGLSLSRVLRPLAHVADTIASRGAESSEPIPLTDAPLEIMPLLQAMNGLATRLRGALDQQKRFVSDAAHELRTPLAALRIMVDNLAAASSGQTCEAIDEMCRAIDRSSALVRQLLEMARVESTLATRQHEGTDVATLVTDCVADVVALADAKEINLSLSAQPIGELSARRDELKLLFGNLLENAIRYTEKGGTVDVSLKMNDTFAEVQILDSGCGVAEADLPHVFDRFFRAAPPEIEGSGLGLAIAEAVAKRYGFRIELSNREDRRGLRAIVVIPASQRVCLVRT